MRGLCFVVLGCAVVCVHDRRRGCHYTPAYPPGELLFAARAQCVLLGATRVDARAVLCGSLLVLWRVCVALA